MKGLLDLYKKNNDFLIMDGGLGTYIKEKQSISETDLNIIQSYALIWSSIFWKSNPDLIQGIHQEFADAGAQIHITSSYRGFVPLIMKHMNVEHEEAEALMVKSSELATNVRDQ